MKMPRRPFYPIALPPDIFGLRHPGLLSFESEAETRKRIAAVEKGVQAAFKAAIDHSGEKEGAATLLRVSCVAPSGAKAR
jgi:hypothetical protein